MKHNLFILFILITGICTAQQFHKLDSLGKLMIGKYHLPGICMISVKSGNVVYRSALGKANEQSDFSDSTRLYIASNTKAFVGMAMCRLAMAGKISYDDPVTKYIPPIFFPNNIDAAKITIRQLLTHTHGLSNDPLVFRTAYSGEYSDDLRELLKFTIYRSDTINKFKYNNLGYLIAGMIIEEVSNQHWQEFIKEKVLLPAGMENTSAHFDFDSRLETLPYEFYTEGPIASQKSENTLHCAGGLYATLDDMGKWLSVFTDDNQEAFDRTLLSTYLSETYAIDQQMGPFSMDEYGNGWIKGKLMGEAIWFHFGSFNGYESMMSFKPRSHSGIFVFVNERIGGQRIAAMLSAYFYLLESNDSAADEKISGFSRFIEPLYKENKPVRKFYSFEDPQLLTGSYYSPRYGHLLVDKDAQGYIFRLGKLESYAYSQNDNIIVEWTPGIAERFQFSQSDDHVKLIYVDFGTFTKLGTYDQIDNK